MKDEGRPAGGLDAPRRSRWGIMALTLGAALVSIRAAISGVTATA